MFCPKRKPVNDQCAYPFGIFANRTAPEVLTFLCLLTLVMSEAEWQDILECACRNQTRVSTGKERKEWKNLFLKRKTMLRSSKFL